MTSKIILMFLNYHMKVAVQFVSFNPLHKPNTILIHYRVALS